LSGIFQIVEKAALPDHLTVINGLPDVGLVGVIATSHLISSLKMEEKVHVDSTLLPPVVVFHKGVPSSPVRIYGSKDLATVISEIAIPTKAVYPMANTIVDWAKAKKCKMMISIGGMAVQDRQDLEKPKVFAAVSSESLMKDMSEKGIEIFTEGYVVGPYAVMLRRCAERGIPSVILLAQSFYNYPDPEAAAAAIEELNKITELKVGVSELFMKGEEIRLKMRDVMRRTQMEMERMKKRQELEVSPIYA